MTHPSDRDLINFTRQDLGARKQEKILALLGTIGAMMWLPNQLAAP